MSYKQQMALTHKVRHTADGFGVFVCVSIMSERRAGEARYKTTGLRGKREGIPEGRADAGANECPKAICELAILNFGGNIRYIEYICSVSIGYIFNKLTF